MTGRDAGKEAVIISKVENNYVLIDGNVRRKKVNVSHIEPLNKVLKIKENASTEDILKAFDENKIKVTKIISDKPKKEQKPQVKAVKAEKKKDSKKKTDKKKIK